MSWLCGKQSLGYLRAVAVAPPGPLAMDATFVAAPVSFIATMSWSSVTECVLFALRAALLLPRFPGVSLLEPGAGCVLTVLARRRRYSTSGASFCGQYGTYKAAR